MSGGPELVILLSAIFWYLLIAKLLGLIIMGVDKRKAKKGRWRIPEAMLFLVAALGGSLGIILGMYLFRHKTKHRSFTIGMPMILIVQIAILLWLLL